MRTDGIDSTDRIDGASQQGSPLLPRILHCIEHWGALLTVEADRASVRVEFVAVLAWRHGLARGRGASPAAALEALNEVIAGEIL